MDRIAITMDTDWVPEAVLESVLNLFREHQVKVTVFATGAYKCLADAAQRDGNFEVGIHPNIKLLDDIEGKVDQLLNVYPASVGVRVHSLVHSSRFPFVYIRKGLKYSSTFFLPGLVQQPLRFLDKIWEFPIGFMDDYYLYGNSPDFSISGFNLERPGLKLLSFHPVHIFINTNSIDHYDKIKHNLKDVDYLISHRREGPGLGIMFRGLLEYLQETRSETYTLKELLRELE